MVIVGSESTLTGQGRKSAPNMRCQFRNKAMQAYRAGEPPCITQLPSSCMVTNEHSFSFVDELLQPLGAMVCVHHSREPFGSRT
jgi:hypothetical protein